MIGISRLLSPGGLPRSGDAIRYSAPRGKRFPVVAWHMTGRCNLTCRHCYAGGGDATGEAVMDSGSASEFLRRLAGLGVPALLLSGGEPMLHPDFMYILKLAKDLGLSVTVSTNGTLIDETSARLLAESASYVGISMDGTRDVHDAFRRKTGAFDDAARGIRLLASRGCRAGLRVTLARPVISSLGGVFEMAEELTVSRVCFYHFIASGRGAGDKSLVPSSGDESGAIERIIEWADSRRARAKPLEILTVGDGSDNVRLYKYLKSRSGDRLTAALRMMGVAAARPTGSGILSVRWDGAVFRNQFMWGEKLGSWDEIDGITSSEATQVDAQCVNCAWLRKICGGRLAGFGGKCAAREAADS